MNNTSEINNKPDDKQVEPDCFCWKQKSMLDEQNGEDHYSFGFDLSSLAYPPNKEISEFVEVQFKGNRKQLFKNRNNLKFMKGEMVIVNVNGNFDAGLVASCGHCAEEKLKEQYKIDDVSDFVDRIATTDDLTRYRSNSHDEMEVVERSREMVEKFTLDMKITDAEWQFDRHRLTIFFTAPARVDFRDLVKEMARVFKTRIELRQISSREETKRLGGGIGPCGINLCCTTFLHDFSHITLEHAKTQQLSNNLTKLTGNCDRLKCCLLFEYDNYLDAYNKYPPTGTMLKSDKTDYKVLKIDVFKKLLFVYNLTESKYDSVPFVEYDEFIKDFQVIEPPKDDYYHKHI